MRGLSADKVKKQPNSEAIQRACFLGSLGEDLLGTISRSKINIGNEIGEFHKSVKIYQLFVRNWAYLDKTKDKTGVSGFP